ncbi:alpha/beta hydrolase [Aeromicrobium endophyticum]|uniref:Alpha/beta hydrolase n=1 Tax=Aeromicrobium endophyticum TaxID=2292704 RepID=A0A371PAB0_9ACTN|nr:alpha/beta hydrolase-fold protein [Aeromicrobium endophyticum]REK72883.1 alpha/beta hydrolase [Aeromicrobium endophyticum]
MTGLEPIEASLRSVLPATRYYEVESQAAEARFAVWVTVPPAYDKHPDRRYPVVYQPDGNKSAPTTVNSLLSDDPINPIEPLIQVQVGYTGHDAGRMLAVRARDLVPPGEPLDPANASEEAMESLVAANLLAEPDAAYYLHNLRHPAADRFLAFLAEELHPLIAAELRVDETRLGLHGYSYGGLFAAWVAMQRTIFSRIGVGSPGILPDTSQVLHRYDQEHASDADHAGRELHVTVCESELTVSPYYQRLIGAGTTQLLGRLAQTPLRGLTYSSRVMAHESHATGSVASYYSYLRACWPSVNPPRTIV